MARLQTYYREKVVPELMTSLGVTNPMRVPKITRITVNMGVGEAVADKKAMEGAVSDLTALTGQKPLVTKSRKSIASFKLRQGDWASGRATLESRAIDTLAGHAPALPASIREVRSITPLDLEQQWGLTEGDLNHGQLILDQALFMRPMPGWSDHRTPVDGLYLGGSGVHGGGGISGAAGRNAARAVLKAQG